MQNSRDASPSRIGTTMALKSENQSDDTQTGDYRSDQWDMTGSGEKRRRRSKKRRPSRPARKTSKLGVLVGMFVLCAALVAVGVIVGLNVGAKDQDSERYEAALKARETERARWLTQCTNTGYSAWSCANFTRAHFDSASKLDKFACNAANDNWYQCTYRLGTAAVRVDVPFSRLVDNTFVAPRQRGQAIITHSNQSDEYLVAVSDKGHIQFRRASGEIVLVLNPATGSLSGPTDKLDP